jgi:hypothetical protein
MSGMKQERGRERYGSTNLVGKAGRKEEQHANHGEGATKKGGERDGEQKQNQHEIRRRRRLEYPSRNGGI